MPRHATGLHAVQTGHQSVAPPRSATASRCAPSQGSRLLGIAPAPAAAPWFRPPESVGNHVNILSTTVVLGDFLKSPSLVVVHGCVDGLLASPQRARSHPTARGGRQESTWRAAWRAFPGNHLQLDFS